jgi:hypothetical protein
MMAITNLPAQIEAIAIVEAQSRYQTWKTEHPGEGSPDKRSFVAGFLLALQLIKEGNARIKAQEQGLLLTPTKAPKVEQKEPEKMCGAVQDFNGELLDWQKKVNG